MDHPLWMPSAAVARNTFMTAFHEKMTHLYGVGPTYGDLHTWSVKERSTFWSEVWNFARIVGSKGEAPYEVSGNGMFQTRFFPDATLNFAENLLRDSAPTDAIVFWGEDQIKRRLSREELKSQVAKLSHYLASKGFQKGDVVAGFVPNTPEAIVAMLATAALGGVWTACSPDFGVSGVLDRFVQVKPKFLVAADGYIYGGKTFSCMEKLREIEKGLPTLEETILFHYAGEAQNTQWDVIMEGKDVPLTFTSMSFNDPLYILFSSGTTGVPKCMVHGVGGTLLQHVKEHQLHTDIKPGDRFFYFTTCTWMMWHWLVSSLASGATLLLYDGSPFYPDGNILFDYADAEGMTHFGTSAKYIDALHKGGYAPIQSHKLEALRVMTSTGSPLVPEGFDYVYEKIKKDLCLSSISGGSDIVSCFMLGNPAAPVWRGELQCAGLGMDVRVWDDEGRPCDTGVKGELVCASAFPAMPLTFLGEGGDAKYHASYFERFQGVWHHGDFVEKTEHGGYVIFGRSDAVLNPGGVRIGTSEIYRQVEQMDEVIESLVVGQDWDGDVRVILFVTLRPGVVLDADLEKRIKNQIRIHASPRHVPAKIIGVSDIPKTKNGKLVELAVRDIIHGRPVKNKDALANPEALSLYENIEELAV